MKVVLGSESFAPNISGVAVATEILAQNLSKAGHEVYVFCPGDGQESRIDKAYDTYTVWRLKSIKNPFRAGFRITSESKKELTKMIKEISPDIIHIQDVAVVGTALRDIGRSLNIPVIITNHFSLEFALSYVKSKLLKPLARLSLIKYLVAFHNKCDCVLTPTETIAKQVRAWGVKTPVMAASNGIFFHRYADHLPKKYIDEYKLKFQIPNNPIVLYLGRIDKDKSISVLVNAIPEVIKETNAHFVFAGSGDLVDEMKSLAESLNVRNNITFLGRLDNTSNEFLAVYKSATLFAIPSTIETQSIVTLEAMSSGLPIVAANANALPELVKNDINGYLHKPEDSGDMAKKIIKILTSRKSEIKKMGNNSQDIASHHEMSKCFEHMIEIYNTVIDAKK